MSLRASAGGMVGYHTLGRTLLARRFGIAGATAGFTVAGASAGALFFGAELLSYLPIGLFAAVIWYLGLELMLTAIWDHGRRMPRLEFAIVLLTPLIALVFGFMPAVAFGVVAAAMLFVIAYSGVDIARLSTTGANFHARVERRPEDRARLAALGGCVRIHKLEGFLFFGSASTLVDRLARHLEGSPRYAIVDLKHVVGIDMSAWAAFERLARRCRQQGVRLIITGLSEELQGRFSPATSRDGPVHFELAGDLDDVLMDIEEGLLAEDRLRGGATRGGDPENPFAEEDFAPLLRTYGAWATLGAGDAVLAQGAHSDHLVFLVAGRCRATLADRDGGERIVARFLPGAILGEIGYYAAVPRTASVTAESEVTAVRIDTEALERMEREDPGLAAFFHKSLAGMLARRLMTTTRLLNDAEL